MATDFDDGQLEAITGGDAEFEREVLGEYLASAPQDIARVVRAIAAGDSAACGAAAHALKGASATIGARGFAAVALELEHAGKQGRLAEAPAIQARLEAEFLELKRLIEQRIANAA
jgi:HPt (histidine-containing phosphotransfer) domain-containing protein